MKIAHCSFINIDYRTDKYMHMLEQLGSCPLHIPTSKFSGLIINDFKDYQVHSYINYGSQMHKGIIGCWMSHKNLIKKYIDRYKEFNNDEWTLILEDDIIINPYFWIYLQSVDPLPDADIIFFDSCKIEIPDQHIIDKNLKIYSIYTSFPAFIGTHCYAIRNSSLNKVYNILDGVTIIKDIDGYYFDNNEIIKYNYQSELIRINYNFQSDRLTAL